MDDTVICHECCGDGEIETLWGDQSTLSLCSWCEGTGKVSRGDAIEWGWIEGP